MSRPVIGWRVDAGDRARLLAQIPPAYGRTVADHVTLKAGAAAGEAAPPAKEALVVGIADDGRGVQALVVRLNGTTDRPGGGTYHITWSLGPGRRAVESNDVIAERGWEPRTLTPVGLTPARF